jgi:flagellar hook assembly protein FlgD
VPGLFVLAACQVGGTPTTDSPLGGPPGTLQVSAMTTTSEGVYTPRNCSVVWIEDDAGTFIKTIDRQADVRRSYLLAWTAKAGGADEDAITGATRVHHLTPLSITWDLTDRTGAIVPDGAYSIRMETTEANAVNEQQNNQGTFGFVKGATVDARSGLTDGGFENVSITFTPP